MASEKTNVKITCDAVHNDKSDGNEMELERGILQG